MKTLNLLYAALTAIASLLTSPVQASLVGINSNAMLGAFDSISWSQLGPNNVTLTGPQNVVSTGGVNATVTSVGNQFQTLTQNADSWDGNFAPGAQVLWTVQKGPDITISLANATRGFGAQIQPDSYGVFTAQITAFNAGGALLGTYTENGISTRDGDNSAIFIGLLDDTAEISKIVFNLIAAPGLTNDFAIGSAEFGNGVTPAVPEVSTWTMILAGAAGIGFAARRRRRLLANACA
jgi:hypothetical protein